MTNPPPVAPVEGHYARMRDGAVVGPIRNASAWYTTSTDKWGCWHTDFLWDDSGRLAGKAYDPDLDIIATISPADMQAVAGGELERLRREHAFMKDQIQKLDQIMTNSIKENDGPNRVNVDGIWYEGPVVENYFKVLRKMQQAYRLVLERVS